ncbi:DNA polymerase III subunit gamma/tau [Membranihabitans marinus]|uniref:DNA polymerase III subunit gamma/tau n=1 Tax=Membranihabitans marinus TaxID=1227546 RepID=UPI001F022176|nr:DNA polymerase III subunit gamma/tau [Membranihabitans marinus]
MNKFIVSARKYRPLQFEDVVGQGHITQTLKNAIKQEKLAHAFLFCGPRGVGKTTAARILAQTINCQNILPNVEPCGQCEPCVSFQKNHSMNIIELDAASNNSVDNIRNLIEQVRVPPGDGKYKLYIIDEVHMLSQSAFNAFLKTLEEPPSYAIFILATTEKHKILPTILSRCQIYDFKRIQIADIVSHLEKICNSEGLSFEVEALNTIAVKADGALRDALSIFDRIVSFADGNLTYEAVISQLNILDHDYYFQVIDQLILGDLAATYILFDTIVQRGFDPHVFLMGLQEHLRQLLMIQLNSTSSLVEVGPELKAKYEAQAQVAPRDFVLTLLDLANACDVDYRHAQNQRLHVEVCLMKMAYFNNKHSLQTEQSDGVEVKKKLNPVS